SGHPRHMTWVVLASLQNLLLRHWVSQTVANKMIYRRLTTDSPCCHLSHRCPRPIGTRHVFRHADPQRSIPPRTDPVCKTKVVRALMLSKMWQYRLPFQLVCKDLLPERLRLVARHTAVYHRPALPPGRFVAVQSRIDVIKRKWQRHRNPAHTVPARTRLAGLR